MRKIHGLDRLIDNPSPRQVIVVSTVKASDRLQEMLTELAVVSWTGDHNRVDWTPLQARRVVCWADKDLASMSSMAGVAAYIRVYGNPSMKLIKQPDDKPPGWGPLMMLKAGADAAAIIAFCKANAADLSFPNDLFAKISAEYRAKHPAPPAEETSEQRKLRMWPRAWPRGPRDAPDEEPSIEEIEAELAAREG